MGSQNTIPMPFTPLFGVHWACPNPGGVGKEQVRRALKPTAEYEEKKPLERIPESEKRALAGEAAGERFRQERLRAEWKWMKCPQIRGSGEPLRLSERHSTIGAWSLGGIWRPVRAVRLPPRLKPIPAPNHASGTRAGVGGMTRVGAKTRRRPDLYRMPRVLKARTGGSGGRGLLEPPGLAARWGGAPQLAAPAGSSAILF